jgi:hypothetical protein
LLVNTLNRQVRKLSQRVAELESEPQPALVPIQSFEPLPFEVAQTILAVVQKDEGVFVASFFDANINASGDSQLDAVEMLKDMIVSTFRLLVRKEEVLGDGPRKQLAVLRQFVRAR